MRVCFKHHKVSRPRWLIVPEKHDHSTSALVAPATRIRPALHQPDTLIQCATADKEPEALVCTVDESITVSLVIEITIY